MSQFDNYTSITNAAKKAALNERRLNHFLKLSSEIYRTEQEKEGVLKDLKAYETRIAVLNFEFAEINEAHPLYETFKENHKNAVKSNEEGIKQLTSVVEQIDKDITEIIKKQQDTIDGTTKMDYDAILVRAKELIARHTETKFDEGEDVTTI